MCVSAERKRSRPEHSRDSWAAAIVSQVGRMPHAASPRMCLVSLPAIRPLPSRLLCEGHGNFVGYSPPFCLVSCCAASCALQAPSLAARGRASLLLLLPHQALPGASQVGPHVGVGRDLAQLVHRTGSWVATGPNRLCPRHKDHGAWEDVGDVVLCSAPAQEVLRFMLLNPCAHECG